MRAGSVGHVSRVNLFSWSRNRYMETFVIAGIVMVLILFGGWWARPNDEDNDV